MLAFPAQWRYLRIAAMLFVGGLLLIMRPERHAAAQSLPTSPNYQVNSRHWPHITVLDFGRGVRSIPDATTRNIAYAWYARHVDVMETSMDNTSWQLGDTLSTYLHSLNPSLKTFGYDYDLTMCQQSHCDQSSPTPNPYFANLPEDQFLHVSEDTQVEFRDLNNAVVDTITIPGCPEPQAMVAACRLQLFIWTQKRWVANLQNVTWRQTTADRLIQVLQTNSVGQPNSVDGLFIDEHGPGFTTPLGIGFQTRILSGGGIREYTGLRPTAYVANNPSPLDIQYSADIDAWAAYLQSRLAAAGKFAHFNVAEYFADGLALNSSVALKGAMTEHLNRPDSNGLVRASRYQAVLNGIQQVVTAGGTVDLAGSWCNYGPAGYTAGNYPTAASRYRMWSLASYYLAKESTGDSGTVYFDPNMCITPNGPDPLDFMNDWLPAYEINVGQPTGAVTVAAQGSLACEAEGYTVFRRQYEHALVLLRVKDGFGCTDYGDSSAVSIPLNSSMVMLEPDGSFSAPMTAVSLRNAEATILFPAPDITPPSSVQDLRTN